MEKNFIVKWLTSLCVVSLLQSLHIVPFDRPQLLCDRGYIGYSVHLLWVDDLMIVTLELLKKTERRCLFFLAPVEL